MEDRKTVTNGGVSPLAAQPSPNGSPSPAEPTPAVLGDASPILAQAERARMFPPRKVYEALVEQTVTAWRTIGPKLVVPGLDAARMIELLQAARRAEDEQRLADYRAKEAMHARVRADHEAYQALLLVRRVAIAVGKADPSVRVAFAFLIEALERDARAPSVPGGAEKPAA